MSITEEQLEQLKNDFVAVYKPKGSIGSDTLCDKLEKIDIDSSQMEEIYRFSKTTGSGLSTITRKTKNFTISY